MPRIDLDTVTFVSGSWELAPAQIERFAAIAEGLNRAIARNPREVFLIEGHTDAVGSESIISRCRTGAPSRLPWC